VFDIGGVLEINRDLGVTGMWESRLGLDDGALAEFMSDIWREYLGTANTELIGYVRRQDAEAPAGGPGR
jgi:hypothetical protein